MLNKTLQRQRVSAMCSRECGRVFACALVNVRVRVRVRAVLACAPACVCEHACFVQLDR